ncbi:MAG: OmpA family protein [Proteobacteria bacterium]|nr:OmpA family protein [Pseudomonadota bacterium]
MDKVHFFYNKKEIMPKSFAILNDVVDVLTNHPEIEKIRIEGHTDTRGSAKYNRKLSAGRAKAVKEYLTEHGIESDRLVSKGYGESKPLIEPEESEDDYENNRRVEFTILKKDDSAY